MSARHLITNLNVYTLYYIHGYDDARKEKKNPIIILVDCNLIQPAIRNGNRHKYVTV